MKRLKKGETAEARKIKRYCEGCRNNFYNGNNGYGIKECWSLKTAKVVMRKFVHIDQPPPWLNDPEKTFSCHHRQKYVQMPPNKTRW